MAQLQKLSPDAGDLAGASALTAIAQHPFMAGHLPLNRFGANQYEFS
jgi:hypothetical protein